MFHEAKPRAAAVTSLAGLELVGDRLDDRDPEPALGEVLLRRAVTGGVESRPIVGNLDNESIGLELVQDLDRPSPPSP